MLGLQRWRGPWGGAAEAARGTGRVGDEAEVWVLVSELWRGG